MNPLGIVAGWLYSPGVTIDNGDIEVRTITEDESDNWGFAVSTGFLSVPTAEAEAIRSVGRIFDRCWAAFDGTDVVGTYGSWPTEVTVPGGTTLPGSAITAVTVRTTHRRRGLLTRMMTAELDTAVERGEALAVLLAAEWRIYGRFGFGAATEVQTLTVDKASARLREQPSGRVAMLTGEDVRKVIPDLWESTRRRYAGEMKRKDRVWDYVAGLVTVPNDDEPKRFHVVASDPDGAPVGYVNYSVKSDWSSGVARGTVKVGDFFAVDTETDAVLWDYLLSIDLTAKIEAHGRGMDDPLRWLVTDGRSVQLSNRGDHLWVRVLDAPLALASRGYLTEGKLVLEVVDSMGYAAGRFALDADPEGATCAPTTESADLTVDASVLGSAYLGGIPVRLLAAAGLVDEHTPGAVERADLLFRGETAPWCSTEF